MKKKLIAASAASAVLAAMPVVGVFAADKTSHTDTLNLTLSQVCTLGAVASGAAKDDDATTHTPAEASSDYTGTWSGDTLSATVSAGNTYAALGTTTFTIRCNDNSGYQLKAASGTNDGETTAKATLVSGSNLIKSSDGSSYAAGTAGTSYWNFKLSDASTGLTIANGYNVATAVPTAATVIASAASAGNLQDGQSVTVTYGAGIDNHQATGTYAGTVVYTLVAQ